MRNKLDLVYVECFDHCSMAGWVTQDELKTHTALTLYQVGWLVDENDLEYKVAPGIASHGDVGDPMVILKSTVKKFVKLDIANQIK